jgi:hypothetical protein
MTDDHKWRKTVAWLKRNFPAKVPVHVRRCALSVCGHTFGWTDTKSCAQLTIKVRKGMCPRCQIDTLLHEWAHALTWFGADAEYEDHGPEWGVAYARIYRLFCEWNYGIS